MSDIRLYQNDDEFVKDKTKNIKPNPKNKTYTTFDEIYSTIQDTCNICNKIIKDNSNYICGSCKKIICKKCKSDKLCKHCLNTNNLSKNKITVGITNTTSCLLM